MTEREKALRDRLWRVFRGEAQEHIDALSRHLLDLEAAPAPDVVAALVEKAFREAHSLKGAARAVNVTTIEAVCQALESVLSRLKQRALSPSPELIDALLDATRLSRQLLEAEENKTPPPPITATIDALKKASWPGKPSAASAPPPPSPFLGATAPPTPPPAPTPATPAAPATPPPPLPLAEPLPAAPAEPAVPPASALSAATFTVAPTATAAPAHTPAVADDSAPIETVRVATTMLDAVRVQAEELLAEKLAAIQRAADLQSLAAAFAEWNRRWASVAPDVHALLTPATTPAPGPAHTHAPASTSIPTPSSTGYAADRVRGFLDWNKDSLAHLESRLAHAARVAAKDRQSLGAKVDHLLEGTRDLLMLPFSWLLDGVRQPVRDLARDQGKEVNLVVEGEAVELDRRVLAELKAPFLHILRNSLDHGIESPADRERVGKPRVATLAVRIAPARNGRVDIVVSDDGRGIDTGKLRLAIAKAGSLDADQLSALDDDAILQGAFGSGVSTSPLITDLSGRGLGLAIVREKAEKLGGSARLESVRGQSTTLRLSLPLSLATFRGVVVRLGDHLLVFPVESVVRVMRVTAAQISTLENREAIRVAGEHLSLVRLSAALGLPASPRSPDANAPSPVAIVAAGGLRLALLVDEILGEQEIVAKKLGPQGAQLPHIAGATVLGSGRPALILDAQELLRLAVRRSDSAAAPVAAAAESDASRKKRILVADDSITSRTLLRSILESAGFFVETALDGIDAFSKLRSAPFDLVVTDVDMPRLHGIGLTEKIRADAALASIPVVLVTSLDSREDRERGLEAGANAYIVKRNFEEGNLLDTVHRLL